MTAGKLMWAGLLAAGLSAGCARGYRIERAEVARIVGTLAADSMQGRRWFTPGADRAARFISAEFAAIGLEPADGLADYVQAFVVYSFAPNRVSVSLNGGRVPGERVVVFLSTDSLHWETGDAVHVVVIGPGDDPDPALRAVLRVTGDALILIHPRHRRAFERARMFASGATLGLERRGSRNLVAVLTSDAAARAFRVEATAAVTELPAANVVGTIPARRPREIVVFSAHYDHLGIGAPVNGDSVYNGADDDASGVTAVIELARYFKASGTPERTLVFAAFTGEEAGGYGSQAFARGLDPAQIVAMLNIEGIGKPAAQGERVAWITGFDRSSLGTILADGVQGTRHRFIADPYPRENLFYRSDNATLARLGVPAHSISTTPIDADPEYHQPSDEVRTLDLDHMTGTIQALARAATSIVTGRATPTRVDTTRLR